MKYGLMLPLIEGEVTENIDLLKNIINTNIDSIWVRDVVISSKDNNDNGSRVSPFLHLSKLAEANLNNYIFGTGVLSALYRNVEVTIQDMTSLSELHPNSNFIYAVGIGGKKEAFDALQFNWEKKDLYYDKWLQKYKVYYESQFYGGSPKNQKSNLIWSKNQKLPKLTVATRNLEILQKNHSIIERNLIWFSDVDTIKYLKEKFPDIELNMFLSLKIIDGENTIRYVDKGQKFFEISVDKLKDLSKEYDSLGIHRLILSFGGNVGDSDFHLLNTV